MSFWMYMLGCLILVSGLAIGAYLLHAPLQWIGVGILCLIGAALMYGVKVIRQKDPPSQE